jgi:hypothetical protein
MLPVATSSVRITMNGMATNRRADGGFRGAEWQLPGSMMSDVTTLQDSAVMDLIAGGLKSGKADED